MDSDGRLSQDELRNSTIRTYSRNIAKTTEAAEISQLNIPLSKDLLSRLRRGHHSPFSCYIDVINAVGEDASQEFAPPDMYEQDAVEHANTLWHRKPREERYEIIHAFEKRIRQEELDLPKKGERVEGMLAARTALVAQRARIAKNAQPVQEPKKPIIHRIISRIAERFGRHGPE